MRAWTDLVGSSYTTTNLDQNVGKNAAAGPIP